MTLVAVGDSIVHADDSWAAWLARAMGRSLHRVSANGTRSDDVLEQVGALTGERYAVACLSVGTNDVLFDWDTELFSQRLGRVVAALDAVAELVVVPTISRGLGHFPGSGPLLRRRVGEANSIIAESGALVIAGDDLTGPRLQQPDRVHPTVQGQLLLADRAAAGLGVAPSPSSLAAGPASSPSRWFYHRIAVEQAPRRLAKRLLGRPFYR